LSFKSTHLASKFEKFPANSLLSMEFPARRAVRIGLPYPPS
jgi:hypothetical protein